LQQASFFEGFLMLRSQ